MATTELTVDTFNDTLADNDIVLLDFWADWCGPCKTFGPIYEQVSDEHDDLVFGKVDTDAQQELGAAFEIRSIPTIAVVREGVLVFKQAGVLPASALQELIGKVRELDMDEVRAEIDAA